MSQKGKKLDILIVALFFPPENSIASHRPYSWLKYWSLAGHNVTVITTKKEYNDKTNLLTYDLSSYNIIEIPMNRVARKIRNQKIVEGGSTKSFNDENLLIKYLRKINKYLARKGINNNCRFPDINDPWIFPAIKWAKKQDMVWDVTVSTIGPYNTLAIGYEIKKQGLSKMLVADYRDLWSGHNIYRSLIPFKWVDKLLENYLLTKVDAVVTVSDGFSKYQKDKFNLKEVYTIHNGFDEDDFNFLEKTNNSKKISMVLTGTIYYPRQDPTIVFETIKEIGEKGLLNDFELTLVGNQPIEIQNMIKSYGISKWVNFAGFVPREKALKLQVNADALLLLENMDDKVDGVLPGKLFEYLRSGNPIWAVGTTDCQEVGRIILESNSGILFGNDKDSFLKELSSLIKNTNKRNIENNKDLIQKYNRKNQAKKYLNIFEKKYF